MQMNRLFAIIYLLMEKQKMTAAELAAHFEVSRRTVLRDIDTLAAAGIPLYTIQGKGGGIALMEGFVLNKAVLTEAEQNQILFALQGVFAAQNKSEQPVIAKLQTLFQKSNSSWIEVDFSRWGTSSYDKNKFELLKKAILGKKAISFRYVSSSSEQTQRTVYPLKLVFKSRAWYLQGYCLCRQEYRTFKISRMLKLCETEQVFGEEYRAPPIDFSGPHPAGIALVLEFSPQVAHRVYDEFDEGCVQQDDDGFLLVSAIMPEDEWLYRYLRTFGEDLRVLSPEHIAKKMG